MKGSMRNFIGLFLGCLVPIIFPVCLALKNVHIKIPSAVVRGEDAILQCFYDLEGDKLYSVKWYRGSFEFFRYSPSEFPPTKQFKIRGLNIKEKNSRDTQVVLENVSKDISGAYSCEVTADQPSFFTDMQTAQLKVIDLPKKDPHIIGLKTRYKLDDTLKANCTSEGSQPAANLSWYINGIPVEEKFVRHHKPTIYNNKENLVTAHSTIKLKVTKNVFINGKMKLRCSATMHHIYHKSSEKSIELQKKRHRSPYAWLDVSTTTESLFEQWEIPAERPPQATVEFYAPATRNVAEPISTSMPTALKCILFFIIFPFLR